jgi:hypothetical protein
MSNEQSVKVTRLFTGESGKSHFEDIEIQLQDGGKIGFLSEIEKATGIIFRTNSKDYDYDWHNAPRRQYIIMQEGQVEVTASDGEVRVFNPGDVLLVEDTTGQGHKSRALGDVPRKSIFVTLD